MEGYFEAAAMVGSDTAFLGMLHLADPALPVGGFSHSAGLETYVQEGIVKDAPSAREFIEQMLKHNIKYTDGAIVSLAFEASALRDVADILCLDQELTVLKMPLEIRQASIKMGLRLMKIFSPLIKDEVVESYETAIRKKEATGHFAMAFGILAHAFKVDKKSALLAYYYNVTTGMITNSVKLIPLSQQVGQQLLFSLQPSIIQLVGETLQPSRDLLGLCCSAFDIRSMQHERLYSRLYMS